MIVFPLAFGLCVGHRLPWAHHEPDVESCSAAPWTARREHPCTPASVGVATRLHCTRGSNDGVSVFISKLIKMGSKESLRWCSGLCGSVVFPNLEFVNKLSTAQTWIHRLDQQRQAPGPYSWLVPLAQFTSCCKSTPVVDAPRLRAMLHLLPP